MLTLALVVSGGSAHALCGSSGAIEDPTQQAIAALLGRQGRTDPAALGAELAGIGEAAIPVLFGALEAGELPASERQLSELQVRACVLGLAGLGRSRVLPLLEEKVADTARMETQLAVLLVLEEVGEGRDLDLTVEAATPAEKDALVDDQIEEAFESCALEILLRDPGSYRGMRAALLDAPPELRFLLARAVGAAASIEGLELLVSLLGFDPDFDTTLLAQVGRIAETSHAPVDESVVARVRAYLRKDDPALLREAALAIGKFEDFEAAGMLVQSLRHEERGVRDSAHWALCRMSGLRYRADPARWESWLRTEKAWLEEEASGWYADLAAAEPARIAQALNQVCTRRFFRDRVAREVRITLDHPDAAIRELGCLALAELGSQVAVEPLIPLLEDHEEAVATAAWTALRSITGEDLPPDVAAWQALERDEATTH